MIPEITRVRVGSILKNLRLPRRTQTPLTRQMHDSILAAGGILQSLLVTRAPRTPTPDNPNPPETFFVIDGSLRLEHIWTLRGEAEDSKTRVPREDAAPYDWVPVIVVDAPTYEEQLRYYLLLNQWRLTQEEIDRLLREMETASNVAA